MAQVLIIEDDPVYRDMMNEALSTDGYEVVVAENGLVGIERARAYRPDLVISDILMEGADGYQVLSTLRSEPTTAHIPFIMITGWSTKGGQRQGMSMGADDYLAKPFNATELLDSVSAQLRKREQLETRIGSDPLVAVTSVTRLFPSELLLPLRTIGGYAEMLRTRFAHLTKDEIRDMGLQIGISAQRVLKSIENYLLFAQLQAVEQDEDQRARLGKQATPDTESLIEERTREHARFYGRDSDLVLRLREGSVRMAPEYLLKIVDELVDNAFKFSPPDSDVEVRTAFTRTRFGLSITDRGKGMSPQQSATLDAFVQFERLEYGQSGLGLGLALARKIAAMHGGALTIKSSPEKGTRVSVEIGR